MYDLIIVGAGPAGSSAGRIAGKVGLKTLMIDKDAFPRYKPCGGAVSKQAISYLDFSIPEKIQQRDIFGIRIKFKNLTIEKHDKERLGTLILRSTFDELLLNKAKETGIEIKLSEKVIDFNENNDSVFVSTKNSNYRTKFLIIAEGAQGTLKHKIRKRDKKEHMGLCMVTQVMKDKDVIEKYIHNAIEIQFDVAKMGYGWIFPYIDHFNIGLGALGKNLKHPKRAMISFLKDNKFGNNHKLKGHVIPAGGYDRTLTRSRVILCGDAAGFVDTFTGEGIAYAIRSGQLASETIIKATMNGSMGKELEEYKKLCNNEFGTDLKYSLFLAKMLHTFPDMFFNMMYNNNEIVEKYLDIHTMKSSYKKYVKWLVPRLPIFFVKNQH
jgi:geranylgeranyl reductase family protein